MQLVGDSGTASELRGLVRSPYTAIYKTGTIEEREGGPRSEWLMFVIGRLDHDRFLPGTTVAGFLYLQESKDPNGPMKKFEFARPIITQVVQYLRSIPSPFQ